MSDAGIDKLKSHFVQAETKLKAERTGKTVSKHVVNLYSTGVSKIVKIDGIDQLRKDIDEDPIIRDSMEEVGALLVGTFGRYLAPLLVLAHTTNQSEGFVKGENVMQPEGEYTLCKGCLYRVLYEYYQEKLLDMNELVDKW